MKIHYFQHVSFEGPAGIRLWAEQSGHEMVGTRLFKEEPLPDIETTEALIIMGGPMSVHDENRYLWLQREKAFIRECIVQEKKVLGICLGAQLIADVLRAKVIPMMQKEIGWFPLRWTDEAINNPIFNEMTRQQTVLHWHGDRFDIPKGARHLASSEACDTQAFLYQDHVLGLQFHLEMTRQGLSDLIANSKRELESSGSSWVQKPEKMLNKGHFQENQSILNKLLNRFFKTSNLS